jgi:hypothetical protein
MTKRVKLLRAKTGTYTDRQSGQEKNSYATIGSVLQRDDGTVMYKFDTVPVNWDGWCYPADLPEVKPDQQDQQNSRPQQQPQQQGVSFDDDIPFANPYKDKEYLV